MFRYVVSASLLLCSGLCFSQSQHSSQPPRLVVGIIVDQMREEYLYRFGNKFGEGGFKRLMNDGFMLRNAHYNYVPTFTGPGHASVYTGSTPAIHGIVSNDWYDRASKKSVNCVEDGRFKPVGSDQGNGDVSPSRLLASTITDELKLFTQMRAHVIGVSIKDRGAVLPAGHTPDGAYWYDGATGRFITSTFYKKELPAWLTKFNSLNLPETFLSQDWNTLLPIAQYTESGADDNVYEGRYKGLEKPVFPYRLNELRKTNGNFDLVTASPFGDDLLTELAKAVIDGESMGKDSIPDFLAISFSSPDIIGHTMGPNSIEIEDVYLRLDKNLKDLFEVLDAKVGQGKYTVFLTGDHAVADVPQYLSDRSFPAGIVNMAQVEAAMTGLLTLSNPGKKIIENVSNDQVYFNQELYASEPATANDEFAKATDVITRYLMSLRGIAQVYTAAVIKQSDYGEKGVKGMLTRGYNHKRSGDIVFVAEPSWVTYGGPRGTTHGSPYAYDTNVPMLFYGAGIKKGSSVDYHPITDIAPTISMLLRIKFPSGCTGQPISEILEAH